MEGLSPATTTRTSGETPERTRCATRTTMGKPAMSAKGLLGKRLEASRAGISTV
jgi:hypothetical protein